MTEDERKNRNPKPELKTITRAELEAMPIVRPADLDIHRVYVLISPNYVSTWNYAGKYPAMSPRTLDIVMAHRFVAPRVSLACMLTSTANGDALQDLDGTRVVVRLFTGPDA